MANGITLRSRPRFLVTRARRRSWTLRCSKRDPRSGVSHPREKLGGAIVFDSDHCAEQAPYLCVPPVEHPDLAFPPIRIVFLSRLF
jgi:hypothetical protein